MPAPTTRAARRTHENPMVRPATPLSPPRSSLLQGIFKSLLLITFVTAMVVISAGFLYGRWQGKAELASRSDEYAANLAKTLEFPLWGFDDETINGTVEAFALNEFIASIRVLDSDGNVLAEIAKEEPVSPVYRSRDIYHDGIYAGRVEITLSSRTIDLQNRRLLFTSALALFVTVLTAFLAARFLMGKFLTAPLRELSTVVQAYAGGDYATQATSSYLEFQDFVQVLGDMAGRIQDKVKELEQAEEKYRTLVENTDDLITWVDTSGTYLFVNPSSRRYHGLPPEECIGLKAFDFVHPDDLDETLRLFRVWLEAPEDIFQHENRIVTISGDVFTMLWTVARVAGASEGAGGFISIGRDVTERTRAERELRNLRNYLSSIVNSMPSVLIGVDSGGRVTQWNHEAYRRTGIKASEALGNDLDTFRSQFSLETDRVREAMETCTVRSSSRKRHMANGEERFEEVTVFPLVSEDQAGAVIRVDDVTERVRLEQMMVQSEKMLSVGGLAAGMAHEINNPLAAIIGYSQNIVKRVFGDLQKNNVVAGNCGISLDDVRRYLEQREIPGMLDGILESGRRAATIVSNMLSFSRMSDKNFGTFNLEALLEATLELATSDYDLKKQYDFKKIQIVRDFAPGIPPVSCEANEIQQVLLNLIKNGAEAMVEKTYPKGDGPRLILRTMLERDMVVLEIEDNGPGISDSVRKRIFEPFFTTKPVGQGTGLGLSVSYFIITELHKGSMDVLSHQGTASTAESWTRFIIKLPLGTATQGETMPAAGR